MNRKGSVSGELYVPEKSLWKTILVFLAFHIVFSAITLPMFIFRGPFENVKSTAAGMSWHTLRHKFIARLFLSDEEILDIVNRSYSQAIPGQDEGFLTLDFNGNHTDRIEVYNIKGSDFSGKLMVVYDPTRVKAGYSLDLPEAGQTVSRIAEANKAVAAVNAGGFTDSNWIGTGGTPMGIIIHDGKVVYD
jgi:exopolysaccharide biosynthesis protein